MQTITISTRTAGPLTIAFEPDPPRCLWYVRAEGREGEVIFDASADVLPDPDARCAWFDELPPDDRREVLDRVRAAVLATDTPTDTGTEMETPGGGA